jgi:hypothetical protein
MPAFHADDLVRFPLRQQKQHDPASAAAIFTRSRSVDFFLFPRMKKVLKGKSFADVEEVKKKTTEALK